MDFNELQPLKLSAPKSATVSRLIFESEEQPLNALPPIEKTYLPSVTLFSLFKPLNADALTEITFAPPSSSGIEKVVTSDLISFTNSAKA